MLRIDLHLHTFLHPLSHLIRAWKGKQSQSGSSMRFPEPCGELSQTVNESCEGRPGAGRWLGTSGPRPSFQGSSCARVTWLSKGASQARWLFD